MPTAWLRRRDYGGLPTWRAAAGGCDLDVQMLGRVRRRLGGRRRRRGRWAWHVRRDGRDVAAGEAGDLEAAQQAAEDAANRAVDLASAASAPKSISIFVSETKMPPNR